MTIRGRETIYRGIRMRSRLEADVAQILDTWLVDGESWQYEPKCFAGPQGQYLPDFSHLRPDGRQFYWEVKPHTFPMVQVSDVLHRMEIIWESEPEAGLCLILREYGSDGHTPVVRAESAADQWWYIPHPDIHVAWSDVRVAEGVPL